MTTHIRKSTRLGWVATTDSPVPGSEDLLLRISTYKPERGGLTTTASVHRQTSEGFLSHMMFSDYHKTRAWRPEARCTEANVEAQHKTQMAKLDEIMAEVAGHYHLDKVAA